MVHYLRRGYGTDFVNWMSLTCFQFWGFEDGKDGESRIPCDIKVHQNFDRLQHFRREQLGPELSSLADSTSFSLARKSCNKWIDCCGCKGGFKIFASKDIESNMIFFFLCLLLPPFREKGIDVDQFRHKIDQILWSQKSSFLKRLGYTCLWVPLQYY